MPQTSPNNDAGSLLGGEPAFLVLGKLRRAHGVRGEIPLEVYSEMVDLIAPGITLYIGKKRSSLTVEATRWKNDLLLLKFEEISDRTEVSALTNALVYIRTADLPELAEGEYYSYELIGLKVYEEGGDALGVLMEILETGANDVYVVQNEAGEETLIPATEETILEVDFDQEKMIVTRLEWYGEGD
jgi:16S rRNA processing protein RimM